MRGEANFEITRGSSGRSAEVEQPILMQSFEATVANRNWRWKPRANSFSTGHSRHEWLHLDRDPLSTFLSRHDIAALRARDCEPLVEAHASSDVDGFLPCIIPRKHLTLHCHCSIW
ncbi:GDNF-inducible zinc finger protein 1 [Fusarium oxysporum f. sp. albedinis]|nr:GDNF-inducible zinc finger protein 1 [Fusarium oxysporum f. sp. albedinis]